MNVPVLERVASSLAAKTAIDFTQEMVRTDSTNGKEDALARQLEARIASLGVGKVWCEKTYEGRLNTLWEVDSGKPGPRLLFTGHLDTKPVCEGWHRDPFDGAIENGRLYGHGVMDMKAGLGSLVGGIMTLIESGTDFRGKITFVAVADHMFRLRKLVVQPGGIVARVVDAQAARQPREGFVQAVRGADEVGLGVDRSDVCDD